jgi:hypothetical protein
MAYDEDLAQRLRTLLSDEPAVTEKRIFGGLAFLIRGNMAVSVSSQGGLLLRIDPAQTNTLLTEPHAQRCVMRGREMAGWLRVGSAALDTDAALARWVQRGVDYARTLPAK